jgi:hypothetical protein
VGELGIGELVADHRLPVLIGRVVMQRIDRWKGPSREAAARRPLRRATGLAIALGLAITAPGTGHAHHTDCTAQGSSDPNNHVANACPEFSPGFNLNVSFPFRDTPSTINLEMSQADHEASTLSWEWFLPKGWRFNTSIRPAEKATGGPAASCDDLFASDGSAPRAEAVSDGNLLQTRRGADRRATNWTSVPPGGGAPLPRGMYFWKSAGSVTTLCFQFRNGSNKWTSPLTLERINLGEESPYGWKVTVPVETLHTQPWYNNNTPGNAADDYSMTMLDLELGWLTSGTWHLENGVETRTVFSRAPRNPVQTRIGTRAIACSNGADTLAACSAPGNQGIIIPFPYSGLHEFPFSVMLPPLYGGINWAAITRAGDVLLPGRGRYQAKPVKGFGFSQDLAARGNLLSVTWPTLGADELPAGLTATGYVLAVHKVTQHVQPTTAAEIAAGRVLFARDFSNGTGTRSISFDLMAMPENQRLGTVDGKYNVSLVTVYDAPFGNGYRSDGLCDGPTSGATDIDNGQGVLCPPDRPLWVADGTTRDDGTSLFQVLVRGRDWPRRYLASASGQPFGVLLLDIPNRSAEYTIWGKAEITTQVSAPAAGPLTGGPITYTIEQGIADQGPSTVFSATGDLMFEPSGPMGGITRFGNFDLESESFTWDFTALISNAASDASGRFSMYNARGGDLDWLKLTVPSGDPTTFPDQILGDVQDQQPSGSPQLITGDFAGVAF